MSKAMHTPGPWSVEYGLSDDPSRYFPGIDGGGKTIILFGIKDDEECGIRGGTIEEQEANARLIAAAPELLDALDRLSAQCARMRLPGQPMSDAEKNAAEIISKATP